MFLSIAHNESGGVVSLDRSGRITLLHVDPDNYVPYITSSLNNARLGVMIATEYNVIGADNIFKNNKFQQAPQQPNQPNQEVV